MKIGIFSLAYIPFVGGAEIAVKEITDRLPDRAFVCFTHRFDRDWLVEEKVGNVRVVRLGKGGRNYYGQFWQKIFYIFRAWREAEKTYRERPFDKIWAIMASYGGLAALLFKLRHPEVPMLLTLQEGDSETHILRRVGIFYPLWQMIFKKADYVQAISNYLADFARRHGAKCPIEVVPNGVDLQKFQMTKSKLQINDKNLNSKMIITTSRLVYKNGVDILIKAIVKVPGVKLVIVGGGPEEEKLKKLAVDLKIQNRVEFLGQIDPEKVPELLAQADIFARPSRSEGLGNSFLEAMAAGLPIIGTPVGGIPDFLKSVDANEMRNINGANGLFVQPDNSRDLAEKILLLLKNDELRKKLGENGRRLVSEKYSWDSISVKINNIFEKL